MQPLNPDSKVPLYSQLASRLTRQIREGEFKEGEKIPSEPMLAKSYGIGRPTVRQATDLLIRQGYLQRKRGSGTFVKQGAERVDLFALGGTIASFHRGGKEFNTHLLEAPNLREIEYAESSVFGGNEAYRMERLGLTGEQPVLLERFYFGPHNFPFLDKVQVAGLSLSEVVRERYGKEPTSADQYFRVTEVDEREAELLHLDEGDSILQVNRRLHFSMGKNVIEASMLCRTDFFQFSQHLSADVGAR